jgi:integrase
MDDHRAPRLALDSRHGTRSREILGAVVAGADPSGEKIAKRKALTVAELCDRYFEDAVAGRVRTRSKTAKRASSLAVDRGRIDRHIKPLLGAIGIAAVTRHDVEGFLHDVANGRTAGTTKTRARGLARVTGGETAANRSVGLLGAIFTYAMRRDMRPDNPVRGVTLFSDRRRERRLSDDEYRKLGVALLEAEKTLWPAAVAAARFIALSGFRRGEALSLNWLEIDPARRTATLADTKTGKSIRPLSRAACEVLRGPVSDQRSCIPAFTQRWPHVRFSEVLDADYEARYHAP